MYHNGRKHDCLFCADGPVRDRVSGLSDTGNEDKGRCAEAGSRPGADDQGHLRCPFTGRLGLAECLGDGGRKSSCEYHDNDPPRGR